MSLFPDFPGPGTEPSLRMTVPSPVDSSEPRVRGRCLCFGRPLLLPRTCVASRCAGVPGGAFGKKATGVFKTLSLGKKQGREY